MKFKRVVACGDMHCGHRVGLTPPQYQSDVRGKHYYEAQKQCWDFWVEELERLKPIDLLIHNGDACDGKGKRSGGNELIHSRRTDQANAATEAIEVAEPKQVVLTRGTPYHVGVNEDFEDIVCDNLNRDGIKTIIKNHAFVEVNGVLFNAKHKIGSTSTPYRSSQSQKENMWNLYWNEIGDHPRKTGQTVFLRSHTHFFDFCGNNTFLAVVLPALQAHSTEFGARQCSGVVDFGLTWYNCYEDGRMSWSWEILPVTSLKQEPLVL